MTYPGLKIDPVLRLTLGQDLAQKQKLNLDEVSTARGSGWIDQPAILLILDAIV